jgi:sodium/hydrogen antiporter
MRAAEADERRDVEPDADNPQSEMASNVLNANEQLERIMEIALVLMVGGMLSKDHFTWSAVAMAACIFLLIRPAAVLLGTYGANATRVQRVLLGWFGIRGIGSVYYLMFAIQHGLPEQYAKQLTGLVLTIVTLSILVHGVSVTPIMSLYESRKRRA